MISLNWVKDYVNLDNVDLKELAIKITQAGINVEKVISNHIDNLVIGNIIECTKHPDSDHLHVCKVDIGKEIIQIVCGASNVRENIKVIVALPNAILPFNFEIKKGKIRGVESNGMICALFELGLEEKTEENYNKGIYELDSKALVGENPIAYLNMEDTLYELDVHKHRNNDCYYHIGFAYEIGCILNKKVKLPDSSYKTIMDDINSKVDLKVETDKCPYYLAKMATDIKIGESPEFIKNRLKSVGMRSINNVVDISNYVMLEYGQPMHFFDYDKLGDKILVRNAKDNEKIVTLDNQERDLNKNDIVITNGNEPVCIAGVMGGLNTDVDDSAKTILIESAIFDSISIRNTANRLNLKSEASTRYGKGLNYEYTLEAINRACHLLEKYANAKILDKMVSFDKVDKSEKIVEFKVNDINKMLGIAIDENDIKKELDKLDFKYTKKLDKFICTIPNRRLDIESNINDIAEEIGRLYGYHNLKSTLPVCEIKKGEYKGDIKYRKLISKRLRSLGLNETKTYTLTSFNMAKLFNYESKEQIVLSNPMSVDKSVIRTSLLPSLLSIYDYNKARNVKDIMLYEISKTYDINYTEDTKIAILMKGNYIQNNWQNNAIKTDFYLIKGILENLLDYLGLKNRYDFVKKDIPNLHPKICASVLIDKEEVGIIGKIHPLVNKDDIYVIEISMNKLNKRIKPIKYKEANRYPSISKDVAFIVDKDISSKQILAQIKKSGGRLLTKIDVFDVYYGENVGSNEKSIAYSLLFSDVTRTLTIEEVTDVFNKIIYDVENKLNARLRDK